MAFADRPDFSEEERSLHNSTSYPESSPDPLALSYNESKLPSKAKRRTRTEPLATSSANAQRRQSDMGEHTFDLSSPSKSMIMNTGRTGGGSPWKIKVTVQAEPGSGSDGENVGDGSPSVKRMTRTTTTTIPLKDPDASSPVKRRGRPRKSEGNTPATRKRNGTPVKRKPRKSSIGTVDHTAVETTTNNAAAKPKKRRGRPRKSILPEEIFEEIQATPVRDPGPEEAVSQSTAAIEVPRPSEKKSELTETQSADVEGAQDHLPELTPLKARSVRGRHPTPAKPKSVVVLTPSASDEDDEPTYEDLTTASQADQDGEDHGGNINDTINVSASDSEHEGPAEGYTMAEGTTIMESENFSMVSVESLSSRRAFSSPAPEHSAEAEPANYEPSTIERSSEHPPSQVRLDHHSQMHEPEPHLSADLVSFKAESSPPKRQQTPAMREKSPSAPPAVEYPQLPDRKESTPEMAKAVKAGVALQGLLDPTRLTPTARTEPRATGGQKDHLDDLFRGFSDGTRRELRAGFKLGEQLANQSPERQMLRSSPTPQPYIPAGAAPGSAHQHDLHFDSAQDKIDQFRMLTPEEQDHCSFAPPQPTESGEVGYPSLSLGLQQTQLVSPARSIDEMSWQPNTPPAQMTEHREEDAPLLPSAANGETVQEASADKEDYTDIWEEEASRHSDSSSDRQASRSPQLQDLFPDDGSLPKPPRAKLPKTWRRKSSSDFHYSDEAEPEPEQQQELLPSSIAKGKGKAEDPIIIEEEDEEQDDEASTASDDTGMFWQQNLPAVFRKDRSDDVNDEKLDLSALLGGEQSILQDTVVMQTPQKPSPIQVHTPRFSAVKSAPFRSSPLRQQFNPRDLESSSVERSKVIFEVPQSSPFRTQVDDTETSDVRQLLQEIDGGRTTDSSEVRHLREEVEAHAYDPHSLVLQDIDEVTEPSRSHIHSTTIALPSSPPEVVGRSILDTGKQYPSLFDNGAPTPRLRPTPPSLSSPSPAASPSEESHQETSLLSSESQYELPPHLATSRFNPLPRCEPWTKTHYKTLDGLFQLYKRRPGMYRPKPGNSNQELLEAFPGHEKYVGARFSSWGYHVTMSGSCVVIAAAFMQLLVLKDIDEYEKVSGKRIQMGECLPGVAGVEIDAHCIMLRLATVILGEEVRRDEKRGIEIRREGGMSIQWPR